MKTSIKVLVVLAALFSLAGNARANGGDWTINMHFEDGNYGVAAYDNKPIQYDYAPQAMVSFWTKPYGNTDWGTVGGFAYLEQMGGATSGPEGPAGATAGFNYTPDPYVMPSPVDTVAYGTTTTYLDGLTVAERQAAMGQYFLRTTSFSKESLVIQMSTWKMQEASFEIWDIDGYEAGFEQWRVSAFNGDWVTPVETPQLSFKGVDHTDNTSYDGQGYVMTVDGGLVFDRLVIEYIGDKPEGVVGLAFNNFTFTIIPEPASGVLLGLGLLAFIFRRRLA